jgi:ketosteroid isomerase-like protein
MHRALADPDPLSDTPVVSEENVEKLKASYEALNRKDFDAALAIAHPEIELAPPGGQAPHRGVDAMRRWMEPDAFEEQRFEPLGFTVNQDKVLVHQRVWARGAGSGIEMEQEGWAVWTFDEEGRATRIEGFLPHERERALEAVGFRE